ncbi:MAG: insulinase family protein [Clostridia bacterium]|nr:insulinase family protein [Clostridia bacterium]
MREVNMAYYRKLDNGIRLVIHEMPQTMSVSIGIAVRAGGAFETDAEDGISHFIEHMMFKGTPTRNYLQISEDFERIGSLSNAYTGKDTTMYYIKSTAEHMEETFDILADFFLNSTFPEEEMEKEKGVIIEEIMRSEDDPDDVCDDLIGYAAFGNTGYGRNMLGPESNVKGFTKDAMRAYMAKRYVPENIVIAMAGNIDINAAVAMVEKWFGSMPAVKGSCSEVPVKFLNQSLVITKKEVKQAHVDICFPGVSKEDPMSDAVSLLNSILGGGLSSRIFQTVREKMALAYDVGSYPAFYKETGIFIVSGGFKASKYMQAVDAIFGCIHDLKKNITPDEFSKAKEQFIASTIYNQESTNSMMTLFAKSMLLSDRLYDPEKRIAEIKKVSIDDLYAAAERVFVDSEASFSLVGPFEEPIPKRA